MPASLHAAVLDGERYLRRIGYDRSLTPSAEDLRALHLQHHYTVPFENLDIHRGVSITLDLPRIEDKIVRQRRGGFCYELNGLFAALLDQLGYVVTLLSARVSRGDSAFGPEFDHLLLRVDLDEPWLADVGFGDSFRAPLRLATGLEQPDADRHYRVVAAGEDLFLEERRPGGGWKPQYAFTLTPHTLPDFAAMCVVQQTSPDSHFTQRRVCSIATPNGRITL
ncbi:MAG TPA: arylamine N-acetyltransferase, partial [Thermomicrobiales bacterium]|nr:arylamine N-acetyltransferase [Thermomicrobiales bacterium]